MTVINFYERRAGVLLHPTSLPSGVLDADAERWLELIGQAGFSVWQVLPLGEPQQGLSPYQCISAFAMNPALLNHSLPPDPASEDFGRFCASNTWVDDYAMFKMLHQKFDGKAWYAWPDEFKYRREDALARLRSECAQTFLQLKWQQFELHERWQQIKQFANRQGILLFGDMPLFVAHDSADVWAHPDRFLLDANGMMKVVTGVPPDYFSATGQRWGNPHYDWEAMKNDHFSWWMQRMHYHLEMFDMVRIDHFRGLEASWVIDAACETAVDGRWQKMPGDELLAEFRDGSDFIPIVAEDLGTITSEVTALRKKYRLPGMSVMQFGFDAFEDNPNKPKNVEQDRVVYTGTHDNDTTRGWYESLQADTKKYVMSVLNISTKNGTNSSVPEDADAVVDALIDSAMNTRASLCIIPLQDILHLGSSARMNTPGTSLGNWQWSFQWSQIESNLVDTMRQRITRADRLAKL